VKRFRPSLLVGFLLFVGCQTVLPSARVRLADEGTVYVYLQPLPREAERLTVALEAVAALDAAGSERSLSLALRQLRSDEVGRQRLLASGHLPAGQYAGFLVRTGRASLQGPEGPADLLVPDTATRIDFAFTVQRGEASVVAVALRYAQSVEAGFRLTPSFAAFRPERPALGLMGFVANRDSDDVTVFDKKAAQVFDVVATGRGPSGLALDQRTRRLYVSLAGEDAVDVIDIQAGRVSDRIRLTPGDEPAAVALTPDGRTLLTANAASNTVSVVDPQSRFEVAKLPVGNGPRAIVLDRTGRRAFVFNTLSNTISVIDVAGRSVLRSIATDPAPVQGDLNRRGDRLYVVHEVVSYVTAINPDTLAVVRRFPVRSPMDAITVDPGTDFVYLAARRDLVVGVHDPFSFGPLDIIDTRAGVVHMVTDADENAVYLVSPAARRVFVFDRIRKRLAGQVDVGEAPGRVTVMGETP
jgi:YVTN family beta-propeller protein